MTKHSFCRDKSMLAATKLLTQQKRVCQEKTFVSTNICHDTFVMLAATKLLTQQKRVCQEKTFVSTNICHDMFVTTKDVFCHNKHMFAVTKVSLSQQNFFHDKIMLVATKLFLQQNMFVTTKVLL